MIELKSISKAFKVAKRNAGLKQAAKAFFHKEYTYVHALNNVSFKINSGEMVGYIGPNGAGKSSTIKVMSGILTPDSGECVINGKIPWRERTAHVKDIGVVFGQRSQLWWDVPVADSFELIKDIYNVPDNEYRKSLAQLTELLNISEIVRTPARQLSLGQRMRCEIAASLLHNPKILFLDEPTIGLDAVSKIAVRSFVKALNKERGTTVILTTHDMQDIEALTERILLIGNGKILLDGTLQELKKRNSPLKSLTVTYSREQSLAQLCETHGLKIMSDHDGRAEINCDTQIISVSQAIAVISTLVSITDISVSAVTAEDMVVSLYREFAL